MGGFDFDFLSYDSSFGQCGAATYTLKVMQLIFQGWYRTLHKPKTPKNTHRCVLDSNSHM